MKESLPLLGVNGNEPDEQFLVQPTDDALSGGLGGIWRLERHLSMLRGTGVRGLGGVWMVRGHTMVPFVCS